MIKDSSIKRESNKTNIAINRNPLPREAMSKKEAME
jgi:hypothetical protein